MNTSIARSPLAQGASPPKPRGEAVPRVRRWLPAGEGREGGGAKGQARGQSAARHAAAERGQRLGGAPVLLQSCRRHPAYGPQPHSGTSTILYEYSGRGTGIPGIVSTWSNKYLVL